MCKKAPSSSSMSQVADGLGSAVNAVESVERIETDIPVPAFVKAIMLAVLALCMVSYAVITNIQYRKYARIVAVYKTHDALGAMSAPMVDKLSELKGLAFFSMGMWVALTFGVMCLAVLYFVMPSPGA